MKLAMSLLNDFELVEAMTTIDLLRRAGIDVTTISLENLEYVKSASNVFVLADKKLEEVNLKDYDMFILPGGKGTKTYYNHKDFLNTLKDAKYLAAICAAPSVLASQNLAVGKKLTVFPGMGDLLENNKAIYKDEKVVIDGNIVSGRSLAATIEFALEIIELVKDKKTRLEIEKEIVY